MTFDPKPIDGVRVLGITGAARHGKDELARAIVRVYPGAERFAFSDAVAAVARSRYGMLTRNAAQLQEVGTLYRQHQDDIWLRCLYGAIADKRPILAVVTGVRYQNEIGLISAMGGKVVGVRRLNAPELTDRDPQHEVESHIGEMLVQADRVTDIPEIDDEHTRARYFDFAATSMIDALFIREATCTPK